MQQIKIPTSILRQFKKDSSHISGSKIVPIYDYIKFEDGTITKHNGGEYIIRNTPSVPFEGSFLVEEIVLNSFIDNTNDVEVVITEEDGNVVISDSRSKLKAKTADLKDFPKIPDIGETKTLIDIDVLCAIHTAVNFTEEKELHPITPYVFVGEKSVSATDTVVGFNQQFKIDLPQLVLPISCAKKIGSFQHAFHYENDRFHIFRYDDTTYGFIKPDAKFVSISAHFNTDGFPKFTVCKEDIISFNNVNMSISGKTGDPVAYMQNKETGLDLSYNDELLSRENNFTVQASGDNTPPFKYWPRKMNQLLKCLPDSELTFHQKDILLCYITGDSGFTSLIMSLT